MRRDKNGANVADRVIQLLIQLFKPGGLVVLVDGEELGALEVLKNLCCIEVMVISKLYNLITSRLQRANLHFAIGRDEFRRGKRDNFLHIQGNVRVDGGHDLPRNRWDCHGVVALIGRASRRHGR